MKKGKLIFTAGLVVLGVFVSYHKPDAGGIAFGHLLAIGGTYFFTVVLKGK